MLAMGCEVHWICNYRFPRLTSSQSLSLPVHSPLLLWGALPSVAKLTLPSMTLLQGLGTRSKRSQRLLHASVNFTTMGSHSKWDIAIQISHQASCGQQRKQRISLIGQINLFREVLQEKPRWVGQIPVPSSFRERREESLSHCHYKLQVFTHLKCYLRDWF